MRILFADDSMTAQNMGKKILTEAGYEVVAVSNGAAAVKKIAEQKPDIIILDIYMPGYTGLEVCDKVRASVETLKTPVLLTVGKMEPYRAEDANRVKADGVIIKPFEASDLLAVVKKLEERVIPKTLAVADQTIRLDRLPDLEEFPPEASNNHAEMHGEAGERTIPAIVDVPDNMATSAAFSDLLGPEPVHSFEPLPLPGHPPAAELSPMDAAGTRNEVVEIPEFAALPPENVEEAPSEATLGHEIVATQAQQEETWAPSARAEEAEVEKADFASTVPEEVAEVEPVASAKNEGPVSSIPDTQPIPVYREMEPEESVIAASPSSETPSNVTSPHVERWEIEEIPVSAEPVAPVAESASPAFVNPASATETPDFDSFNAKVDARLQEIEAIVSASEARQVEIEVKPPVENGFRHPPEVAEVTGSPEDDFDARVAAAMTIYDEPVEEEAAVASAVDEWEPVARKTATFEEIPEPASFSSPSLVTAAGNEESVETPCSFEYSPPVNFPGPKIALESAARAETPEPVAQTVHYQIATPVRMEPSVAVTEPERKIEAESEISSPPAQPGRVMKAIPFLVATPVRVEPPAPAAEIEPVAEAESKISFRQEPESTVVEAAPTSPQSRVDDEKIISEIEAQLPAAPVASTDPGLDTQMIASAVHRVLERLRPQLIEEISRELKNSK